MKRLLFLAFLMPNLSFSEPSSVGPINYSGGLNVSALPTLIPDQDSPDLCNCSPSIIGAMQKRNGSQRLIKQAFSSNSVTSLYQAYSSTANGKVFKMIVGASGGYVFVSTKDPPSWVIVSSNNSFGQHYNFVTMNGKIIIAGENLTESVRQYDIVSSSQCVLRDAYAIDSATGGIVPRGKYQIVANNYYILANVEISTEPRHLTPITTYYANRILYSLLNNSSSMTAQRYIDFNGGEIMGLGSLYGGDFKNVVNVFGTDSIAELSWTNALNLPNQGGDWQFTEVVKGFGVIAPRSLVNTGSFYAFLAKDGVRLWDGGRRTRLSVTDESRIISGKIKPLIDEVIRRGTYKNAVMIYYPKKEQLILSIEHPDRFPKGKNNYTLVYDFRTGEWWPYCGWNAEAFTVADNSGDTGQLFYGDSIDGYVHKADIENTQLSDSRQELSLDVMDSSFTWAGSTIDVLNVIEGSAAVKISIFGRPNDGQPYTQIFTTSMTKTVVLSLGEWNDRTRASLSDKISFKAFVHNVTSITALRLDLEVKQTTNTFDTNFTSVTISSSAFPGNRIWTTFEIPLSSWLSRPDWTDLSIESVPFYSRFNAYGIRFVASGVNLSSITIDDLRFVGNKESPIRMSRTTKLFDFNSPSFKGFGTMLLTYEKASDASFNMDIYNDFGQKIRTENISAEVPKEILVFRTQGTPGFSILDSVDFSVLKDTKTNAWDCLNGVMDAKKITCGDRLGERLLSFSRADFSTFTMTYGSFGSGTSNFNLIHEIRQFKDGYLINDLYNQRIKVHSDKNLGFIKMYGQLGGQATSYHQPTGGCADSAYFFVFDESNDRITQQSQSTFGIVNQIALDHNSIADGTIACGDKSIFIAYNRYSTEIPDALELILEKRDKGNAEITQRVSVKPIGVSTGSYRTQGSIGLLGRYILVPFSNEEGQASPNYYIQKRLQSNLEVINEYSSDKSFFTSEGYGLSFNPMTRTEQKNLKAEGRYIQMKFYDDAPDNYWQLYQMSPFLDVKPLTQ